MTTTTQADGGWRAARRGPWIVYRYPLFREGNRPREVRGRSQEYFWPLNANEQYPRYYGGIHARELQDAGTPPGDRGFRGYAW
ncbi:MAG: hypothetical protein QGG36_15680 [Pirellulaceae bacterium]|nr:hypothetical protein [Pirellulaceae bacterium]